MAGGEKKKSKQTAPENKDESMARQAMPEAEGNERAAAGKAIDEAMINEILSHLDGELQKGVVRMSVTMDDGAKEEKAVSHKCCNSYGRPANETVGLLDMYTDRNAGRPDRDYPDGNAGKTDRDYP